MPINRAAEDDWLSAATEATEDVAPTDEEWEAVEREELRNKGYADRYTAWMAFYSFPAYMRRMGKVEVHCLEPECKGKTFYGTEYKTPKGHVLRTAREDAMNKVERHILRGHVDPPLVKTPMPKECPF